MTENEIIAKLNNGFTIYYAPIIGSVVIMDDRKYEPVEMTTFLSLRSNGKIYLAKTMRQGHSLYRGLVNCYKLVENLDENIGWAEGGSK